MRIEATQAEDTSPVWETASVSVWPNFQENLKANIRVNSKRSLPFLLDSKYEPNAEPLAIVGGGPSLKHTMPKLREFKNVMVCSSAHDHLVSNGIHPDYAVFCDAMPSPPWLTLKQQNCTYLIASQCDPTVFEQLADCSVLMWDVASDMDKNVFGGRGQIYGGCTTAMRSLALGFVLGFSDFHFFGVDSSFDDDKFAYPDNTDTCEVLDAKINGRVFKTTLPLIAQAQDLQRILTNYGHMFSVTVHGDSLLADVWKDMRAKTDALWKREKAA